MNIFGNQELYLELKEAARKQLISNRDESKSEKEKEDIFFTYIEEKNIIFEKHNRPDLKLL